MSSSHRRENPSRSAAEATSNSSRHKSYRFKSYLEANTQERARFDAMQDHVPDKIAEVIASFREDKLTVQPHRRNHPEVMPEPERGFSVAPVLAPVVAPAPAAAVRRVSTSTRQQPRVVWPWYVCGLVAALSLMIWFDASSDAPAVEEVATVAGAPAPAPAVSGAIVPAAAPLSVDSNAAKPAPDKVSAPAAQLASASAKPVKTSTKPRSAAASRQKPVRKAAARQSAGAQHEEHYYSEDLTGLLQGN